MTQVFVWAICGLVAAWLIGAITLRTRRDKLVNLLLGVTGGALGGFLVDVTFFGMDATLFSMNGRMIYTSLAAILGSAVLVLATRYVSVAREY
jgi:uncharacterized membrane protein YeaQ/YmgE (transglycosylase-associated protein family)